MHTVTQVEKRCNIGHYMTVQKSRHTRGHTGTRTRSHTHCAKSPTEVQYIPHKPIKGASYNSLSQNTERGSESSTDTERNMERAGEPCICQVLKTYSGRFSTQVYCCVC